jgi:glutamate-1-semialdehyde aminotransferase
MKPGMGLGTTDVLDVCMDVELACAELYHFFADLFKDDRESLLLWVKTAMEEENHARLFALVSKLRRNNIIESIKIELIEAEITLLYVKSLIEKVKENPPAMEEALQIAIELKGKLSRFMMGNIVSFADESYAKSFLAVSNSDRNLEMLQKAYARIPAQQPCRS